MKPANVDENDWLDLIKLALSTISLIVAKVVQDTIENKTTAWGAWEKLSNIYETKSAQGAPSHEVDGATIERGHYHQCPS